MYSLRPCERKKSRPRKLPWARPLPRRDGRTTVFILGAGRARHGKKTLNADIIKKRRPRLTRCNILYRRAYFFCCALFRRFVCGLPLCVHATHLSPFMNFRVVTGANNSGKSTYLKQAGAIYAPLSSSPCSLSCCCCCCFVLQTPFYLPDVETCVLCDDNSRHRDARTIAIIGSSVRHARPRTAVSIQRIK